MYSLENYLWVKPFNISNDHLEKWKQEEKDQSFLAWALSQKILNRKSYFEWAVEHHQMPILENTFFEQNPMTVNQWEQVQNLSEWSEELSPIGVWKDTVFVGCLEYPKETKNWDFKHRLVLVTDLALRMHWKSLEYMTEVKTQTNVKIPSLLPEKKILSSLPEKEERIYQQENDLPSREIDETPASLVINKDTLNSPSQSTEDKPLDLNTIKQSLELNKQSKKESQPAQDLEQQMMAEIMKAKPNNKNNLEKENQSQQDLEQQMMAEIMKAKPNNKIVISKPPQSTQNKSDELQSKGCTNTRIIKLPNSYTELFEATKTHFCGSLVLVNDNGNLKAADWSGRIDAPDKAKTLVSLNDTSIFKILGKGHPFHGFVVDTESNKKFFSEIGWDQYPKHVSAVPLKNEEEQLEFIFVGLSINSANRETVKKIEEKISNHFSKKQSQIKIAA